MQIKLKFKAMSILMAGLQETQMWAVYQMGTGNEMPTIVTKEDLTCIIEFLFKQLDWIDEGPSSQPSSHTTVESPIFFDTQISEDQTQKKSLQQLTFEPDQTVEKRPSAGDGVNDASVEIEVDQNDKQKQYTQVEDNDVLVDTENNSGDDALTVMEKSLEDTSKLEFGCSLFDQKFSKESFIAAHMCMTHKTDKLKENSDLKNFSCSQCDYKCRTLSKLKRHEMTHSGDKPFLCSQCGFKCNQSSALKRHERNHTGDKPFNCSRCDKKFSQLQHLKTHERTHTGDKPFSCSHCNYKCNQSSALKTHERVHTGDVTMGAPLSCSHCDYKSSDSSNLKKHERIHTCEKLFTCSQCDYKSSDSSTLKRHRRTHTGDKPFHCSQCDFKCIQLSDLKQHKGTHW